MNIQHVITGLIGSHNFVALKFNSLITNYVKNNVLGK